MKIRLLLNLAPYALAAVGYRATDQRDVINADIDRWIEIQRERSRWWPVHESAFGTDREMALLGMFAHPRAFRDVLYYRLSKGNLQGRLAGRALSVVYRGAPALTISCPEIGPGFYLAHGHASIIAARRIGARCVVYQNVTVGWDAGGRAPVVEDDVTIYTGAVVFGDITIGTGATIGANAVVNRDIPGGAVAVGVPAVSRARDSAHRDVRAQQA